jgi:hypothetical protein
MISAYACVTLVPFATTVIVITVRTVTLVDGIEKVPVVAPAAIVVEAGGVACVLFDEIVTTSPPAGAGPLKVIVPVAGAPP